MTIDEDINPSAIAKILKINVGNRYIKLSGKVNNIQGIDSEKIKYNTGRSSKYIRLSLLLDCYKVLIKEKILLITWIKINYKTQSCEPQLILAIFVEAGLGNYCIPNAKSQAIGISYKA